MNNLKYLKIAAKAAGCVSLLILPSLVTWAGFGFIMWNWNPGEWTQQFRAISAFFALMLSIPVTVFVGYFYEMGL